MSYQSVFARYELKYLLNQKQKQAILDAMMPYMKLDQYGRTTIRNIYYDTNSYRLIRHSIEKPVYKEKLRIRSYTRAQADSTVFVELKKKYDSVVYKRRLAIPEQDALQWLSGKEPCRQTSQISEEINYFMKYYQTLQPSVFLSYEREAYFSMDKSDFRVTFDDTILCRETDISLRSDVYGASLLPEGMVLMEIKCSGGIPLWMAKVLSEEGIFKTNFSKYGIAYQSIIYPKLKETANYA